MADKQTTKRSKTFKDITSQKFGRLTAVSFVNFTGQSNWLCQCECGNTSIVSRGNLMKGNSASCGCLKREQMSAQFFKHGIERTREHNAWRAAKSRCFNKRNVGYANYGLRGITMSAEWRYYFLKFLADMGPCPPGCTLDRIDNNGPYTGPCSEYPNGNCRWATRSEQARNNRRTVFVVHEGETVALADLADRYGFTPHLLARRLRYGRSLLKPLKG